MTAPQWIDCIIPLTEEDLDVCQRSLDCYLTYQNVIAASKIREVLGTSVAFEFFQEDYSPASDNLFVDLN